MPENNDQTYAYPFDPTGTLATNKVINEAHAINPPEHSDYYFIVPLNAPFFQTNLKVQHHPSGRVLQEGVDFSLGYKFIQASLGVATPIYGAICIYDLTLSGSLEVTYQTLGGVWSISQEKASELLLDVIHNPRISSWEQVVERPHDFPVIDHEWHLDDMVGATEVVEALSDIEQAILVKATGGAEGGGAHALDRTNPHQVTKEQIGLGEVQNYGIASVEEAETGTATNKYITPYGVSKLLQSRITNALDNHLTDTNNPHSVTKEQVGLSNVENYRPATILEAQAGVSDDTYTTPKTVKHLIDTVIGDDVLNHSLNRNNPHQVTKSQVGLGNVYDFPVADTTTAIAGSSDAHYMTPYKTKLFIDNSVKSTIDAHITDTNNPHQITKVHVGLSSVENYPIATKEEAEASVSNTVYMTPLRVKESMYAVIGQGVLEHVSDINNPHNVTAQQVGLSNVPNYQMADIPTSIAGVSGSHFISPEGVSARIVKYMSDTYGDLGARVNTLETTLQQHLIDSNNPHQITLNELNGYDKTEIDALLSDKVSYGEPVENAQTLQGKTIEQITQDLMAEIGTIYATETDLSLLESTLTASFTNALAQIEGKSLPVSFIASFSAGEGIDFKLSDGNDASRWMLIAINDDIYNSTDNGISWTIDQDKAIDDAFGVATINDLSVIISETQIMYRTNGQWAVTGNPVLDIPAEEGNIGTPIKVIKVNEYVYAIYTNGIAYAHYLDITNWNYTILEVNFIENATTNQNARPVVMVSEEGMYSLYTFNSSYQFELMDINAPVEGYRYVNISPNGTILLTSDVEVIYYRYSIINNGWQTLELPEPVKIMVTDTTGIWAYVSQNDKLYYSTDNGYTWKHNYNLPTGIYLSVFDVQTTSWLLAGQDGNIFIASNG